MSTYDILQQSALSWPDRPALIDAEGVISYRDLYKQTELLKSTLINTGLGPGMGLGVLGRNSRFFVAAMFAGMGCGATVLPLSHQLKQAELDKILKDTCLHAVLDDQNSVYPLNGASETIVFAKQTLRYTWTDISRQQPITALSDAAFIRYTSGTTGTSKGVVLSHRRILERIQNVQQAIKLTPNDAVLWVLPMAYHFLVTILLYLCSGAAIILCKDFLAQTLINDANQYNATLLYAAPMHFRLLAADQSGKQLQTLKYAISTSSAIPLAVAEAFKQRFKLPITQAYGIIEAGLPLLDSFSANSHPESVGYPIGDFEVALLDKRHQPVPEGEPGRLAIRGPGLFDAYLTPWQPAAEIITNGWFMTGDLARRCIDGRIIICGREKTMINVSGNKAFPEEIEAVLNDHPDIVASRVFGQPHPLMGEIVCAEIILVADAVLNIEAVLHFCRSRLSIYKVPQRLLPVDHIELTGSGKLQRL
jgi:acyl-CoA synthetase (AMP-forming)/AMP-acid ligase II